jgi:hypothetical protein
LLQALALKHTPNITKSSAHFNINPAKCNADEEMVTNGSLGRLLPTSSSARFSETARVCSKYFVDGRAASGIGVTRTGGLLCSGCEAYISGRLRTQGGE